MSTFSIILICFIGIMVLLGGYVYTILEFMEMSEHPDQFSDIDRKESVKINE